MNLETMLKAVQQNPEGARERYKRDQQNCILKHPLPTFEEVAAWMEQEEAKNVALTNE